MMGVFKIEQRRQPALGASNLYSLDYASSIGWADDVNSAYNESPTVFNDLPRRLYSDPSGATMAIASEPILSIGYLRHLNLSGDDEYMNPGYQPDSQIGSSYFNPYLTRLATVQQVQQFSWRAGHPVYTGSGGQNHGILPGRRRCTT